MFMFEKLFKLKQNNSTVQTELLAGVTTFMTMVYILIANSEILAATGMPLYGVFVATALTTAVGTIAIAFFANVPFAMAPGMGLNTFFVYTICMGYGYHWREALALTFVSGVIHLIAIFSPLRKSVLSAIPRYIRAATGAGLGLFVAYMGIKNAGLIEYTASSGNIQVLENGMSIVDSSAVPRLITQFSGAQVVAIVGIVALVILLALESTTGDRFGAVPVSIIVATFVGIPLSITKIGTITVMEGGALDTFREVALGFFGRPGLLSIFDTPERLLQSLTLVFVLATTSVLDSVGSILGIGNVHNARIFDEEDMERFEEKGIKSKLDKSMIAQAWGAIISPLFGSSASVIFVESVTGISAGGRTGLTSVVVGILFLICLPLVRYVHVIPKEAVAASLILAGASFVVRLRIINWRRMREAVPALMTILITTVSYSIFDGVAIGILFHVAIYVASGRRQDVKPVLYVFSALYLLTKIILR